MSSIGLINPGEMGASVGAAAVASGHQVFWVPAGRSDATHARATRAGLATCPSMAQLVSGCDVILSVCPPHSAHDVATDVASHGFKGLYLEGNAIAPDRARDIAALVARNGATVVDGGIIGGPAWSADAGTVLHLSGERAAQIQALFAGSPLHTNIVGTELGAASALKMTFAAYTKGTTALLSAILAVAEKEGVRADLEKQWGKEFSAQTRRRVTVNTAKAWRFVGEMQEIAATFDGAGQSPGFHQAAAQTFNQLAVFKDTETPSIEAVLAALLKA